MSSTKAKYRSKAPRRDCMKSVFPDNASGRPLTGIVERKSERPVAVLTRQPNGRIYRTEGCRGCMTTVKTYMIEGGI